MSIINKAERAKAMREYFTPAELNLVECALKMLINNHEFFAETPYGKTNMTLKNLTRQC